MKTIIIFFGIIFLIIIIRFIWDTFLTNNAEKRWDDFKKDDPVTAAKIDNNKGLDFSTKPKNKNLNKSSIIDIPISNKDKLESLRLIADDFECHPSESKAILLKSFKVNEFELDSMKGVKQLYLESRYEEARRRNINVNDTKAAIHALWCQDYINELSNNIKE